VPIDEATARTRLPDLLSWLERIRTALEPELGAVKYRSDDDFAFMALCFLSKQIDHAYSLPRLSPLKDTALVSRCMFEGLVQLLWAAHEKSDRPARWRAFAVVEDWRTLPRRRSEGFEPTPEMMERLNEALQEVEPLVLTAKAKEAKRRGDSLPADPYHKNWRAGTTLTTICDAVDAADLRDNFYSPYSGWAHWSPATIGDRLSKTERGVQYGPPQSYAFAASAVALAIPCLLQTAYLAFAHLDLPGTALVEALRDEFEAWHAAQKGHERGEDT